MKNSDAEAKAAVSSRLSDVSVGRSASPVRSISKYSSVSSSKQSANSSYKPLREDKVFEGKINMVKLIVEIGFLEKRQTLEQQAHRLRIATEVAKSKARAKLLKDVTEVNGKVDRASIEYTLEKGRPNLWKNEFAKRTSGGNTERSGKTGRGEVIYYHSYQEHEEYEAKPNQFTDEKIVGAYVKSVRYSCSRKLKKEVLVEIQIWDWKEIET